VPCGEQPARLVERGADDPAVRDPRAALVVDAERHDRRVLVRALVRRDRHSQPELVVAAAEARRVVMGRDPRWAIGDHRGRG
jgi:hypothetical protein